MRDQRRRTLADVPLTWSSSAPSIAAVDSAGRVTAVDNGRATIIASAGEASGEAVVTVAQQAATLELAPPDTVRTYGDTARVAARSSDVNGHAIPPTLLTWTSGDTRIVTVDSTGLVTATGNGTASVSAWSGPFRVSVDVTVYDLAEARKTDREVLMILFNGGRSHVWPSRRRTGEPMRRSPPGPGCRRTRRGGSRRCRCRENQIGGGAGGIPSGVGQSRQTGDPRPVKKQFLRRHPPRTWAASSASRPSICRSIASLLRLSPPNSGTSPTSGASI